MRSFGASEGHLVVVSDCVSYPEFIESGGDGQKMFLFGVGEGY